MEDFPEPQWSSMSAGSNGGMSPSFPTLMHPGKESDGVGGRNSEDDRNPSITSAGTDSSQKPTRANANSQNKMAAFFGASPDELARRSSSNLQLPSPSTPNSHNENQRPSAQRQGSWAGRNGPPASPDSSRPRTPPSSDVTPWAYQDPQVSMLQPFLCLLLVITRSGFYRHVSHQEPCCGLCRAFYFCTTRTRDL